MSILNRLNRIIRSNISELKSEGSSGSVDQVLGEMETSLKDARRQRAKLLQQEKQIVSAIRQARDKADQWEERAMMALKRDEEDLAREALIVRNEALDEAAKLREELEEHRMYLQDIESALEALEMKLEGTRGRLRASNSSGSRRPQRLRDENDWDAEFRRRVQGKSSEETSRGSGRAADRGSSPNRRASRDESDYTSVRRDSLGDESLFDEMDRMSSKVDEFEAHVEAMRELSDDNLRDPDRSRLEDRFRELEGREDLDRARRKNERDDGDRDDLADLKKKFEE